MDAANFADVVDALLKAAGSILLGLVLAYFLIRAAWRFIRSVDASAPRARPVDRRSSPRR